MELDQHRLQDEAYRHEVLNALLSNYQDRIFHYCVTRLGDACGEEVAQEVFLTAWQSLQKFRGQSSIATWLTGIAKNKCLQTLRNRQRRRFIASTFMNDIRQHVHTVEAADTAPSEEQFAQLTHCLAQLQDSDRILVNLRYTKNLSVTEVVEVVGKSEAAVRKQLLRALERLRRCIRECLG